MSCQHDRGHFIYACQLQNHPVDNYLVRCADHPSDAAHIRFKDMPCPACTLNYINSSPPRKAGPEIHASINSFDDIAKDYNQPPIKVSGDAGNFGIVLILIVISLALIGFALTNSSKAPESRMTTSFSTTEEELCRKALDSYTHNWDARSAYEADVREAKQRSLAPNDCVRILGLTNQAAASTPNPSAASQDDVCKKALNTARSGWDNDAIFASDVREAQKRGLSIEQCRRILGFSPLNSPLSGAAQDEVCMKALNPVRTSWDNNATFANYVQEAQRRGLSIDQCRRLLGFPAQGTQGQQQAPDDELCRSALSGDKTQWDSTAAYSVRVQEARNRGFTVEKCRSILGISSPPPPQLVGASSQIIGWSTKFDSNQIYIAPDVQDRVGDSGYSYETQFYSNDGRIPKTDFVMFVLSRGNIAQKYSCAYASPQKYFESVLSNRRDKVNTLYPGENQDLDSTSKCNFL